MRNPPYHPLIEQLLNIQDCLIYPTSYVPNKETEYDIPYPTYIPYIGPNDAPLGVKCHGRVVTCFTPPLKTTATDRKYMPKRNVAVTNSSESQGSRFPPIGNRTYACNLGTGRTAAEVAPIAGNRTTAGIHKLTNGIPQVPQ